MAAPNERTASEVLESHLAFRRAGDLEADLAQNYATDVILLSAEGVHHGHDGVRKLAQVLAGYAEPEDYTYGRLLVEQDFGLLYWSAEGSQRQIHDGADSFVVRDGRIRAQSIHYSTRPA